MARQGQASGTDYEIISHADMRRWQMVRHGLAILYYGSIGMGVGLLVVGGIVMLGAYILEFGRVDPWSAVAFHPDLLFAPPLFAVIVKCSLLVLCSAGATVVGLALCTTVPSRSGASALAKWAMMLMIAVVPAAGFSLSSYGGGVMAVKLFPLFLLAVFVFPLLFVRQILTYLHHDRLAHQALSLLAFSTLIAVSAATAAMFSGTLFLLAGPVGFLVIVAWWLWLLRRTRRALDADMADWLDEAERLR